MAAIKTATTLTITAPTSRSAPTRISRSIPGFQPKTNRAERRVDPSDMTAGRILIVDDDVRLAGLLVELLAAENFQPAHASNGAALACLARRSFDLLILDVMIPQGRRQSQTQTKMDAFELLRRLRKDGSVPVLMLTA